MPLLAGRSYVRPSGYKVHIEQPPAHSAWHLVGTVAEGTLCHKPCTVSGGGKSEISKPISDAILPGPIFVADFDQDMERVAALISRDYSTRFRDPAKRGSDTRPILSPERSLGSVIKLLTPAEREYTEEYNAWLRTIPQYLKEIVFVVKRHYSHSWGDNWRKHFTVDLINGNPGNELKCDNRKLCASYLRIGYDADGAWRVFGLREDYHPAYKIQMEDDITASVPLRRNLRGNLWRTVSSVCSSVRMRRSTAGTTNSRKRNCLNRTTSSRTSSRWAKPTHRRWWRKPSASPNTPSP
jgi:hypothetical protein